MADRPLSADVLRLLDRAHAASRKQQAGGVAAVGRERASARFNHVRRWTQPRDEDAEARSPRSREPLLSDRDNAHIVEDGSMERATRDPIARVQEMLRSSTAPSAETKAILGDRALSLAVVCAAWILALQGLQGLQGLAFSYFMKDELKVSPATLTSISSISSLPWVVKPLYGFCSDALPIYGFRRKPYLFFSGVVGCVSWVCMAEVVDNVWGALICVTLPSLAMAFANVLAEAIVVEKSNGQSQEFAGRLQTCIYGAKESGAILSSFVGGWLLSFMTARHVFLLAALIPLSLVIVSLVVVEERCGGETTQWSEVKKNVQKLFRAFCHPQICKPVLFLFAFNATPASGSTWFFFYTDVTKFSSTFLGTMGLVGSIFSLLGVVLFDATLRKVSFFPIFIWGTVVSVVLGCTQIFMILRWNLAWGIPDEMFALGEASIQGLIGWICSMPIFILAARLCPKGMEATMYATIMSFLNLGGLIGGQLGAGLTVALGITEHDLDRFWLLVLICNLSSFLPLALIGWISEDEINAVDNIDEVVEINTPHESQPSQFGWR